MLKPKRRQAPFASFLRFSTICARRAVLFALLSCGHILLAQNTPQGAPIPFQDGSANDLGKMFDSMFGPATAEESKLLSGIKISIGNERAFGQSLLETYLAELKLKKLRVLRKGRDVDYLRQLVETVHPLMTNAERYKQFTVLVVESDDVDAKAIAGGTLVFTTGLLKFAHSEAAVIGIVGHELSHLDRGHLILPLKRAKLIENAKGAPNRPFDPQKFAQSGTMMVRLMARPFRPEDEAAADQDGTEWAYHSGYDPRELADLFARLHIKNQDQKVPFGSFFRTHPYNEDRCAAITAHFEQLRADDAKPSDLFVGKQNLKKRIARSVEEFAD